MPCYKPLQAWRGRVGKSGKRAIVFNRRNACDSLVKSELRVPCGQCIGCRLERSRQWAMRCVHEASQYADNCFVTLTYDDDHLPEDGSLNVRDFQLFMKRLRKEFGSGIRFFQCGEYGEQLGRPHHHAILFNFDFKDKYEWVLRNSMQTFRSATLERLWPHGLSEIGSVTFESAAYVARYVMKKVSGIDAVEHYVDEDSGVILKPEYVTMSRRPGIAAGWFRKWLRDVYPHDYAVFRGIKMRPPKFYDKMFEAIDPNMMRSLKNKRVTNSEKLVSFFNRHLDKYSLRSDNCDERLAVKEEVKASRLKLLFRPLEAA